jgi:two-component system cell cycle sensor histidine kinase/response regulator CckA
MFGEPGVPAVDNRDLCVRVAEALSVADPARCFGAVLSVLEAHGIRVQAADDPAPSFLSIERQGRGLRLSAPPDAFDAATRALLAPLVGAALSRCLEHEETARIRERMDMLSSAAFEGIMIHADGVIIDANQRFSEMYGYEPAEMFDPQSFARTIAPEDQAFARDRIARRIEGVYAFTGIRKDGTRFPVEVQSKQGRLGDKPVRVVALRDVTERERTHALLRESEVRLRHLVEATFDFVVLSRGSTIIDVRGPIEAALGYKPEQLVGRSLLDFIVPRNQPAARAIFDEDRLGMFSNMVLASSGEEIPVETVAVRSSLDGEPVRLTGVRDMRERQRRERERRELELRVERTQRLESLGTLAGGIAHDFNNLLVGILMNAELLASRLTDPEDLESSESIRVAGERAASLTRQLLAYAGKTQPAQKGLIDLAGLGRELCTLLDATLSRKARLDLKLEPRCIVLGDRATIMQVLMNLLTNASDALKDQPGVIEMCIRRVNAPGAEWREAIGAAAEDGEWVLVRVKDTGVGMDAPTAARIFEPFFSTKAKGHGLGLAACLGIVKSHAGAIRVESTPGAGTSISLLLPAAGEHGARASKVPHDARPKPCKVLVVDDEPLVRANVRRSLAPHGFSVFEAPGGLSALSSYERIAPDVLIVDFTMPDLDGGEVIRRIREAGSTIPIILSSGHVDSEVLSTLPSGAIQGLLHKPYGPKALLATIEQALLPVDPEQPPGTAISQIPITRGR